ncbi:MAG TPA: class I SAM-dependent methyltransferase [Candidatus Binatia bacterium]|nr:class I SAM-dependent methyltransferase [Candidatus Binatia bacterium]
MTRRRALLTLALAAALAGCSGSGERFHGPDVPFVATPEAVSLEMLKVAAVTRDDVVFDLGSGDGRIVIAAARDFGARGVGVEIDPKLIAESRDAAVAAGVGPRVTFLWQDLFVTDLGGATVVTLYLSEEVNVRLRPKLLRELAPGTRVVSHQFDMGDWEPDRAQTARSGHRLYFWLIPASAAGAWQSRIDGGEPAPLALAQQFQKVTGTLGAQPVAGRLSGERIELTAGALTLRGVVRSGVIEGEATAAGGAARRWSARRAS